MQLKYRLPLVIFSSLALAASVLHAQEDDEDEEEFGSFGFFKQSPQTVTVALNMTQGPQVNFANLGTVTRSIDNMAAGRISRNYMNGSLDKDSRRSAELDADGHALYPEGGHYQTYTIPGDTTSVVTGDYLSYTPGITRSWRYANPSQANRTDHAGTIAFDVYSAYSQHGAPLAGSRGYSGGVELVAAHLLTDPNKRVTFSLTAGVSLTGINSSKSGQVNSTLHTVTDYYNYYNLSGTDAPVSTSADLQAGLTYHGPTSVTDTPTGVITETTTTLSYTPVGSSTTDGVDQVVVSGKWKIRGAYFTFKVGPQVTAMLTRSLGVSASVGVAGSYVGTTYSVDESFHIDGVTDLSSTPTDLIAVSQSSNANKFLSGYYANIDANWTINGRTGLFAGFSYEKSGEYTQSVGGRTARIDLATTAGVRGGFNIKF